MPFTGRIGTQNSQLGDIVLGIVDAFDLPTIGFRVHVLSSKEIRVRFDRPVTDSALSLSSYVLEGITPGAVVPGVDGVEFYDADRLSVVVRTSRPLTWTSTYSMQVVGVQGFDGEGVAAVSANFTANVSDPPRAIGAFLSKRGMVDVVFDRPVGPFSPAPAASIRNPNFPPVPMIYQPWAAESMPENTLRFVYPNTTPLGDFYFITTSNVVDASNNVGGFEVDLTLQLRSPPPYNSSSLSQMQFADAYVSEIVPNVNAATVRVYFSGPASPADVLALSLWNVTQGGPHVKPDTVNSVLVPDCITLTDAINFLEAVRTTFADHLTEASIHKTVQPDLASVLLLTPPAVDSATARTVYGAIQGVFKEHALENASPGNHLYPEPNGIPELPLSATDAQLIALTNDLKLLYNQHLAAERSLPWSGAYPVEIGTVTDHASQASAYPVVSQLTYFADLHVTTSITSLPIRVRGSIRSEDLASVTDPLLFSGDILARAVEAPAVLLSKEIVVDREVRTSFDKEVFVSDSSTVSVRTPIGLIGVRLVPTSTLPDAIWLLNSLVFSYSKHLGPAPAGAVHVAPESQFFVSASDYATTTDLPSALYKANLLKSKYNGHVRNAAVHTNLDEKVLAPDAFDFPSLVVLLGSLREAFVAHNGSGDSTSSSGVVPLFAGHHLAPGEVFLVAKLFSTLAFVLDGMLDGEVHQLRFLAGDSKWDVFRSRQVSSHVPVDTTFPGFASHPALASALPRPGLVFHEDREGRLFYSFEADSIEVYFSKRMHRTELNGGTGGTVSIAGGSLILKGADWVDERTASVRVMNMEKISYTLSASDLVDLVGNPL
jgi:hypothetical protein